MTLDQLIGQPGWSAVLLFVRQELVRGTIQRTREAARSVMLMQNPGILRDATRLKQMAGH